MWTLLKYSTFEGWSWFTDMLVILFAYDEIFPIHVSEQEKVK